MVPGTVFLAIGLNKIESLLFVNVKRKIVMGCDLESLVKESYGEINDA